MAQVDRATRKDVDQLLARALAAWGSLPDVQRDIDAWELEDQLAFVEEWPLEDERLQQLAMLARIDALNTIQQERYRELMVLVDQHGVILERLLRA
jgi:hypothetical protein